MTIETNKTLFNEQIQKPCIVDFYTSGCPVCERLAPVYEDVSGRCDDLAFFKVNLDEDITLAERYSIDHVPTLILFEAGQPVRVNTGCLDQEGLIAFIAGGGKPAA